MKRKELTFTAFYLILILSVASLPQANEITDKRLKSNINTYRGSPFSFVLKAVGNLVQTTANIQQSFANNDDDMSVVGEVVSFIDNIPVVGEILKILQEGAILREIAKINNNLKLIQSEIKTIGTKVDQILQLLQLSIFQKEVAEDIREIDSCYENFLLLLQESSSIAEKDRLLSCYSILRHVREIGRILNDDPVTFLQKPLFPQIIELSGYCDGKRLMEVFRYLFGVYSQGCTAIVAAENLKYNGSSTTYQDECKETIKKSNSHLRWIYDRCKVEACDTFVPIVTQIIETANVQDIGRELRSTFPWFRFLILNFDGQDVANLAFFGETLSRLVLPENGLVKHVILWSEFANEYQENEVDLYQYGLEYTKSALTSKIDQLNLTLTFVPDSGQIGLIGFMHAIYGDKHPSKCIRGNNGTTPDFNDKDNESETLKYFKKIRPMWVWTFALTILGIYLIVPGVALIILCQIWCNLRTFRELGKLEQNH